MPERIEYPQYRKYENGNAYFKVLSSSEFEEIRVLGAKKTFHSFTAKILPDRNYIYDLTFDYEKYWVICDQTEYENLKQSIEW